MGLEYLRDDDSFVFAQGDRNEKSYLVERRVARQVSMEMDMTCGGILNHLGISTDGRDDEFIEAHAERLQELEDKMTALILDICRRKKD